MNDLIPDLIVNSRVIVTCGAGGVGKTTVAASIGIAAALKGRRCVVVTIDPAKRLADALGITELTNEPAPIELSPIDLGGPAAPTTGELWACMLDTKATFDAVVRREAKNAQQADDILANTFYRNISSSLSGTQEYMAMEKVHDLVTSGRFDLVVVDTPPTQHALDFVTAPRRLVRLLDNTVFKLLVAPGRGALRVVSGAAQTVLRPLTKVIGGEVVTDAIEFFRAFDGMEEGFRTRATETLEVLTASDTAWLLVSSPQPEPIRAAVGFAEQIANAGIAVRGLIINRAEPEFEPLPTARPLPTVKPVGAKQAALMKLVNDHRSAVASERETISEFFLSVENVPHVVLEQRADDVHDLEALKALGRQLLRVGAS